MSEYWLKSMTKDPKEGGRLAKKFVEFAQKQKILASGKMYSSLIEHFNICLITTLD
jgi:hypothetical protein